MEGRGAWRAAGHGLTVNHDLATEQLIKKRPPRHTFNRMSGTPQGPVGLTQKIHLHRSGCLVED